MTDDKKYTHILQLHQFKSESGERVQASVLYRHADKIVCAMQQNAVVVMGDNPHKKTSHTFMDAESAALWMRTVYAERDAKELGFECAVIEEIAAPGSNLYIPNESEIELPGMGAYNPMRKFN
jgi:hypothetical protein